MLVDTYNFQDSGPYSGNGVAVLSTTRGDLERFYEELGVSTSPTAHNADWTWPSLTMGPSERNTDSRAGRQCRPSQNGVECLLCARARHREIKESLGLSLWATAILPFFELGGSHEVQSHPSRA